MKIKGINIQFGQGFKLLGHKCIGSRRHITADAEEAA